MIVHAAKAIKHRIFRRLARLMRLSIDSKIILSPVFQLIYKNILNDKALKATRCIEPIKQIINSFSAQRKSVTETYSEIATFILNIGQPEIAKIYFKLGLDNELTLHGYSLYLQCLLVCPSTTDEIMHNAASKYNSLFFANIQQYTTHENNLNPNKVLRIGYICHFFHNSVSQSLLIPFLRAHDKSRVKIFCYSDTEQNDVPHNIKNVADVWRDTKSMNDDTLAELIRSDEIDVLLEMNGHVKNNRYCVIAKKPSPIQASYYNHCGTTGISAIDYNLIGDEVTIPSINTYSESIYFFKGVCGIAVFPEDFPDCSSPPFLHNQYITFGSFGAAHKVNHQVISLWSKILKQVPNSKLYMKASVLDFPDFVDAYKQLFKNEDIDLDRIKFEGHSEHREMLRRYSQVDIALDTFPYAAGTTTMEAIWMGVPVITLAGNTYSSQNGKGILNCINRPELITYSPEEYLEKTIELAKSPDRLIAYRQQLRTDFKNSPRADAKAFARKLEDAYVDMWHRYCKQHNTSYPLDNAAT